MSNFSDIVEYLEEYVWCVNIAYYTFYGVLIALN